MPTIFSNYPKKSEVQRTKNKIFEIKKNKNKHKKSTTTTCPVESILNSVDSHLIESYNNDRCIMDYIDKGLDKYEIHERIWKRFKIDLNYDYIESFFKQGDSKSVSVSGT